MSDVRQMPLFPSEVVSPDDLNRYTALKDTFNLFAQFLYKEGKSEHTVKAFTSDLQLLAEYTGKLTPIGRYSTRALNEFLHWMEFGRGVPCSRKTYARRVTTLKVYFKWLYGLGALSHDPAKAVLQRSGPAPLSNVLSEQQIKAVVLAAREFKRGQEIDLRPELLFRLILETGIKKSEAMRLIPSHFDSTNPRRPILLVKQPAKNVYKERKISLSTELIDLLDDYLVQYRPKETIFNCTARNLEYILSDIGTVAGIAFKISFEVLRWTCAVRDYRDDMDEDLIREKLGLSEASWSETGTKVRKLAEKLAASEQASV